MLNLTKNASSSSLAALASQRAVGQATLVEGPQVLVQVPGTECIPAVQFRDDCQVAEPVVLQCFVKVAWGVGRYVPTDIGDLQQLILRRCSSPVSAASCSRSSGMPRGEQDQSIAGHMHGPQLLTPRVGVRVAGQIQLVDRLGNLALEVHQSPAVDLVVQHGMARRSLFHELRKQPGLVGAGPGRCHGRQDLVAHAATASSRESPRRS